MNTKRLKLVLNAIDIALVLIVVSTIGSVIYLFPYFEKFQTLSDNMPQSEKFNGIRQTMRWLPFYSIIPTIVVRLLYGFILWQMRKIVRSILNGDIFRPEQAIVIRKIAFWFLAIACVFLFFSGMFSLAAFAKGNMKVLATSLMNLINVFERYVLPGLVGLALAEVFIYGMKIKEEQEFTV